MKPINLYLSGIALFLTWYTSNAQSTAHFMGKINEPVPDSIRIVYHKTQIASSPYASYFIKPGKDGTFNTEIPVMQGVFVNMVMSDGSKGFSTYVSPGDTTFVSRYRWNNDSTDIVLGKNAAFSNFMQAYDDYFGDRGTHPWKNISAMDAAAFNQYIKEEKRLRMQYLDISGDKLSDESKEMAREMIYYEWLNKAMDYPSMRHQAFAIMPDAFYEQYLTPADLSGSKFYTRPYHDFQGKYLLWQYKKQHPQATTEELYDPVSEYAFAGNLLQGKALWNLRLAIVLRLTDGSAGSLRRGMETYTNFISQCPEPQFVAMAKESAGKNLAVLDGKLLPGTEGDADAAFSGPVLKGNVQHPKVTEASEIVPGINNPGSLWIVNDSGNEPIAYLINEKGETEGVYKFAQQYGDYEASTMLPGQNKHKNELLIGDIGDNGGGRRELYLYKFEEPKVSKPSPEKKMLKDVQRFTVRYPDGPRDAETMMYDPAGKQVYIVSKREQQVHVYAFPVPSDTGKVITPELQGIIPYYWITDGSISADGKEVLLKTIDKVMYWQRKPGETLVQTLQRRPGIQPYIPEQQGEGIAFKRDGSGYYTISEGNYTDIRFYPRKK